MSDAAMEPDSHLTGLVERARHGDTAAFGELFRIYLSDVRDFCARRISDPLRAEDLAQETFVRAFESIMSFHAGAPFWPWLSTIAKNLCVDELRQRGRAREELTADPPEGGDSFAPIDATADTVVALNSRRLVRALLTSALSGLSERDRGMLLAHAVEEKTWEQIAASNGATVHSVRNLAWRARIQLRAVLGDTLRDLRSRIAFPLAGLAAAWRRLRNRWRSRFADEYSAMMGQAFERGASLLVGLIVVVAAVFTGSPSTTSKPSGSTQIPDHVPGQKRETAAEGATTISERPADATRTSLGPVKVGASAESRDGAALPSVAKYRLEVHGPDGQLLYAEETSFKCGDGRAGALLPEASPIKAYC